MWSWTAKFPSENSHPKLTKLILQRIIATKLLGCGWISTCVNGTVQDGDGRNKPRAWKIRRMKGTMKGQSRWTWCVQVVSSGDFPSGSFTGTSHRFFIRAFNFWRGTEHNPTTTEVAHPSVPEVSRHLASSDTELWKLWISFGLFQSTAFLLFRVFELAWFPPTNVAKRQTLCNIKTWVVKIIIPKWKKNMFSFFGWFLHPKIILHEQLSGVAWLMWISHDLAQRTGIPAAAARSNATTSQWQASLQGGGLFGSGRRLIPSQ